MSRLTKRPAVNHTTTAAHIKARPRTWLPVGEYRSTQSAEHMAYAIRTAYAKRQNSPYAPAGSFEARTRLTEYGALLEARYIGPQKGGTR